MTRYKPLFNDGPTKAPKADFLHYTDTLRARISLQNMRGHEHFVEPFIISACLYIIKMYFVPRAIEGLTRENYIEANTFCQYFHDTETLKKEKRKEKKISRITST